MDELEEYLLKAPTAKGWKRVGVSSHHGINVFLSALRTKKSSGIGELLDLLPIIDWCSDLKMDVIQLLPLNNSRHDPSPYNPISSCAINFIYLSLHDLPYLDQFLPLKMRIKEMASLNDSQRVAYAEVAVQKLNWLGTYIQQVGSLITETSEFKNFVKENLWLESYALFKTLKIQMGNNPAPEWPEKLQRPSKSELQDLCVEHQTQMTFYFIMQFLCFKQLKYVKEYANSKGIFLKGDIPILVSRDSADVWEHPNFFSMDLVAGAPPDAYQPDGQCWGFPIYDWNAIEKDQFKWWKQRLHYATYFYDLYRIDHTVGFFRIWTIPMNRPCREGSFLPSDNRIWEFQGTHLLDMMISSSNGMLPIAEDLGTVPTCVPSVLLQLGLCGTKVIRWEWKEPQDQTKTLHYLPYEEYPRISLTCVSTHDTETLKGWWIECPKEAKAFASFKKWEFHPKLNHSHHVEILWDSHHTPSLFHINLLQEYLALFPELVWPSPEEERINVPGTFNSNNWTYRYRPTVEEIVSHPGLKEIMKKILFSPSPHI